MAYPSPTFVAVNSTSLNSSTVTSNSVSTSSLSASSDVVIGGNLTVNGGTVTLNSTQVSISDPVLTVGSSSSTATDTNGRGIAFNYGTGSAVASGFLGYDPGQGKFVFLTATTNTSEVISGTTGTLVANLQGNAATATAAVTAAALLVSRTITVSGDASGSVGFDGSANAAIPITLAATAVTAGAYGSTTSVATFTVDAKGRLISAASAAIAFPVTSVAGRTGSVTIASADITDATDAATAARIVKRDASGNFAANTITATLSGNSSSASKLANARTFAFTGDATGSGTFDGTANYSAALTLASTTVTAGSYGASTAVSTFTVDAKGRLTAAGTVSIAFPVTAVFGRTGNVTLASSDVTGALGYTPVNPGAAVLLSSDLTIAGNLTVTGTTTTVNATQMVVSDPVLTLGSNSTTTNDGKDRGIEFKYGTGSALASGFFGFDTSAGQFVFLTSTTNTSEVITGTTGKIVADLAGNAATATKLAVARTIAFSGDATGSAAFDGSANTTTALTLAASGVNAGSYGSTTTVGTFTVDAKGRLTAAGTASIAFPVTSVAGRTGAISIATADITDAASANTASTIIKRDASGNFAAGIVTATLAGNASSATTATTAGTLTSARTIAFSGDATGSGTFDGSANTTTSLSLAASGVTAGSYGSATSVGSFSVDGKGRLTSAASTAIAFPVTSVAGKTGVIVIASSDLTDGSSLAKLSGAAFTGTVSMPKLVLSSFITQQTSGAGTDSNLWDSYVNGQSLNFRLVNDQYSSTSNWLVVARSGLSVSSISFAARPTFASNLAWDSGNFNPSSYATLSGCNFTGPVKGPQFLANTFTFLNTGAGTDSNIWDMATGYGSNVLSFRMANDAYTYAPSWLSVTRSGTAATAITFSIRPTFAGNAAWDSGNFNPATYASLAGANFTGLVQLNKANVLPTTGGMASSAGGLHNFQILGGPASTDAAFLAFNRTNQYAGYFGLDADNVWKVGGWSFGSVAYQIWHAGNFTPSNYALLSGANFSTNAGALPTAPSGTIVRVAGADGGACRLTLDGFGSSGNIIFRTGLGSAAAPTALKTNQVIGHMSAFGYGATAYSSAARANVQFVAVEDWTDTAQGTSIYLRATAVGSTVNNVVATIGASAFTINAPVLTINSSTAWHAGNLNPSNYAPLAGAAFTGPVSMTQLSMAPTTGAIAQSGGRYGNFTVYGGTASTDAAFLTFERSGQWAVYFGLDTDNYLKVGGYSLGNTSYRVFHQGMINPIVDIRLAVAGTQDSSYNRGAGNYAEPYAGAVISTLNFNTYSGGPDYVAGAKWRYLQKQDSYGNWYTVAYA